MVAAPQFGQMNFLGIQTKQTYAKDVYFSDVVAGLINFDSGGGASASSETFWTPPEAVVLRDVSIHTGLTDTTKIQIVRNGVPTGDIMRYIIQLDTLANRPKLNIPFGAGVKIASIQMA